MKKFLKIALIVTIVLWVAFIWSNSMWSKSDSAQQSGRFSEILRAIFTLGGQVPLGDVGLWILSNVRKLAHFTEYFILASLLCLYGQGFVQRARRRYLLASITALVAVVDETVQIFALRGASIFDVLLDCLGGLCGFLFTALMWTIVKKLISCHKEKRISDGTN